jgi:hypothetical protein
MQAGWKSQSFWPQQPDLGTPDVSDVAVVLAAGVEWAGVEWAPSSGLDDLMDDMVDRNISVWFGLVVLWVVEGVEKDSPVHLYQRKKNCLTSSVIISVTCEQGLF